MQPLPTSIHSSTDSPSLLMVSDFSMSRAAHSCPIWLVDRVTAKVKRCCYHVGITISKLCNRPKTVSKAGRHIVGSTGLATCRS